jgi:acyl-ACP thioesterase
MFMADNLAVMDFEIMMPDVGYDSRVKVKSLFNIMQSCAISHTIKVGSPLALSNIIEKNFTWVYNRFYLEVDRYAKLYDKITCETWRPKMANNAIYREFLVTDSGKNSLCRGISSVLMIDMTKRKPVQLPETLKEVLKTDRPSVIEFKDTKPVFDGEFAYSETIKARYDDIDINNHMNNSSYAQIFFENGYRLAEKGTYLKSIDIFFTGEIVYDDELECSSGFIEKPGVIYHKLFNKTKNKVASISVTEWA